MRTRRARSRGAATITGIALVMAALAVGPTAGATVVAPPPVAAGTTPVASARVAVVAQGTGTGYLHTDGGRILDATGAEVRLTGINWFGMETDNRTFHGLWAAVPWRDQVRHMAELGFNTLRIPFAGDALKPGAQATSINSEVNPDLIGLSPLEILDKVIAQAGDLGMRVILDRHRPSAAGQTPLWYTATVSEASMIADWRLLAERYADNPTVVGADLFNEPHAEGTEPNAIGACWGCGDPARDWRLAAERIGNAIHEVNSDWLIVVEGVSCLSGGTPDTWDQIPDDPMGCTWWGGNLAGAREYPVRLAQADRLVYSAHDYGLSVYDRQPWFDLSKNPDFPANLPAVWDHFWGYLPAEDIAPVLVGEFGSTLAKEQDAQWLAALMDYMDDAGISFTYWSWNPNSGDTGGIVGHDWSTVNEQKYAILADSLVPPLPRPQDPGDPGDPGDPDPVGACTATVEIGNSWPSGYQAAVTVTNDGVAAVSPWQLTFALPDGVTIGSGWGGTFAGSGGSVTVSAPSWSPALAPGASLTVGFVANGPSSSAPSGVALNGAACG